MGSAVAELKAAYDFDVEIVKKTDTGLLQRLTLPKFPAVELDGQIISEGREISKQELQQAIIAKLG